MAQMPSHFQESCLLLLFIPYVTIILIEHIFEAPPKNNFSPKVGFLVSFWNIEIVKMGWGPSKLQLAEVYTTKCDFIVLSQVNEISLTVNEFH